MTRSIALTSVLTLWTFYTASGQAPAKPPTRTVLQQVDVATSPAQETIVGTVEIVPGSGNVLHTHNGTEIGYVLSGRIQLEVSGLPLRELGPGESFLVPRGVAHRSILMGGEPAKLLSTWTVDKRRPLLVPAP